MSLFHGSLMSLYQLSLKVMGMVRARVLQCHKQAGQSLATTGFGLGLQPYSLRQGWQAFCKGPDSKYFMLGGQMAPHNSSALTLNESSHRRYVHEWIGLRANKTVFPIKPGTGPSSLLSPGLRD